MSDLGRTSEDLFLQHGSYIFPVVLVHCSVPLYVTITVSTIRKTYYLYILEILCA